MKQNNDVKYIVMLGDGMADLPIESLGGKTPLTYADKPFMNRVANKGINGRVFTVPKSMKPESDTANMCVMGFDPLIYSSGRSPLEAISMGIEMKPNETAIRANLVSLSDVGEEYEDKIMLDHSADEISTEEAKILIKCIEDNFGDNIKRFYPGVSYRHCVIWENCHKFDDFARPHDIIGKKIGEYLPYKDESQEIRDIMKRSFDVLNDHPVNIDRAKRGLKKANSLWFWGPGKKPSLPNFTEKTGLTASVICAVDLIKGIGLCAGMDAPFVEDVTGTLDTNYHNKAEAAYNELKKGKDLVYIHVEAPDECGHRGETENKVKAIEYIDREVLGYLMNKLDSDGTKYKILLLPDHPTPISARTHTYDAVPFAIYKSYDQKDSGITVYDEKSGYDGGIVIEKGHELMDYFINC